MKEPERGAGSSLRTVPGPKSKALHERERAVIAPGLQQIAQLSQLVFVEGRGRHLRDADDNEYLDFFAGVAVASLGHAHPRFVAALQEQVARLAVGSFTTPQRVRLLELIAELAPGDLRRTQLYSGGAEAVEAAIRLAKSHTKKFEVVGFWGGFHGKTGGVMGLIGDPWKQHWGPLAVGTHLLPYADCYHCPFQLRYPQCGMHCLDFVRSSLKATTAGAIAAIVVEPMQGTAGNIVPPPEFLPGLATIAAENDALLIADEMITGFGRTGKPFGCDHTGVVPDVMTIGKGLGSGFPVSGLVTNDAVAAAEPFSKPSSSSSSFGGNPLAATAACTTIETIVDEDLAGNAERVGGWMLGELRKLQEKYPFIGDVRGVGLLIGVELVTDRATKEPLPRDACELVFREALRRGLLVMSYGARIRIHPPLTLTESEARDGVAILDEAFTVLNRSGLAPA